MFMFKSDWLNAVVGGAILSLATSVHLILKGRVTGMSGTFFRSMLIDDFNYNMSLILGMMTTSTIVKAFFDNERAFEPGCLYLINCSFIGFLIAGFLVGFGTKLANGCTSGHGLCGLPRLSKRSIVAVISFMISSMGFANLRYYVPFLNTDFLDGIMKHLDYQLIYYIAFGISIGSFFAICIILMSKKKWDDLRDCFISYFVGALFAYGLLMSGMVNRHKVMNFLIISSHWDISLLLVLATGVGLNLITFQLILHYRKGPLFSFCFDLPSKDKKVDVKLVIGAFIFGIGWGFAGICPGPAMVASYVYIPQTVSFVLMMALGQFCAYWSEDFIDNKLGGNKHIPLVDS